MKRRTLFRYLLASGACMASSMAYKPAHSLLDYKGKLLINVQLDGGVDFAGFCDPKLNKDLDYKINNWSDTQDIGMAGNISYAPFAGNKAFFDKHHKNILVINGVDTQTNAHSVGITNTWSGRNSEGYPALTAIWSAEKAASLPLTYLNFGGFGDTQSLVSRTRINDIGSLRAIVDPNDSQTGGEGYRNPQDFERIKALQRKTLQNRLLQEDILHGEEIAMSSYYQSFLQMDELKSFSSLLPQESEIKPTVLAGTKRWRMDVQAQVALLAFKSGLSVSADLHGGGFDTHANHDAVHEPLLKAATETVDFIWSYAEQLNLADRLVLIISSDFSRTPEYNSGAGKDHHSVGSYLIMEKNAGYTNKVIGETDYETFAIPINPNTLTPDSMSGITLTPAHVHKALRKYLGIRDTATDKRFPFSATEDLAFFG